MEQQLLKKKNVELTIYIRKFRLDSSQVLMQEFHYNYIKNKYSDKAKTFLTDTDSLIYKIEAENICEEFYKDKELFDCINHPKDSKYYSNIHNLVAGKFKDETSDVPIKYLVGLKSKIFTFITEGNHESKKAKGID